MKRKIKPLIYVFCEGESEIEYVNFLKEKYEDVAVIQKPVKGLFSTADKKFKKKLNIEIMRKSQTKSGSSLMSMMDKQEVGIRIKK